MLTALTITTMTCCIKAAKLCLRKRAMSTYLRSCAYANESCLLLCAYDSLGCLLCAYSKKFLNRALCAVCGPHFTAPWRKCVLRSPVRSMFSWYSTTMRCVIFHRQQSRFLSCAASSTVNLRPHSKRPSRHLHRCHHRRPLISLYQRGTERG